MPRLTIEAANEDESDHVDSAYEEMQQGSDYFDFCFDCGAGVDGEVFYLNRETPSWLTVSVEIPPSIGLGLFEIEHPPYDGDLRYECVSCGCALNHNDT